MQKKLKFLSFLLIFCFVASNIPQVNATTLFSDGFESGDFSAWTGTGGSPTVQSTIKHSGTYAASFPSLNAVCSKYLSGTTIYVRTYFYFTALPTSEVNLTPLEFFDTSWGNIAYIFIQNSSGTQQIGLGAGLFPSYNWSPLINTWYYFEMVYHQSASAGYVTIYLNGGQILTTTVNTNQAFYFFQIGQDSGDGGSAVGTLYADDVVVADAYIGPMADTTPPTFGTITSNTTIAGNGVRLNCTITDDVAVANYSIAWNNTETWTNQSIVTVSGTPISAYFDGTWNATVGNVIEVQVWASDSSNNTAYSSVTYFTLTSSGWNEGFMGIPNSETASINGIPKSEIQSVNGVP